MAPDDGSHPEAAAVTAQAPAPSPLAHITSTLSVPSSGTAIPAVDLVGESPPTTQAANAVGSTNWYTSAMIYAAGLKPTREGVELGSLIADTFLRVVMSGTFVVMSFQWLNRVCGILDKQTIEKTLSDTVLVALLTTTTINVLGLLYFVANYLFPKLKLKNSDVESGVPKVPTPSM